MSRFVVRFMKDVLGDNGHEYLRSLFAVIASQAKQSTDARKMDCFVASLPCANASRLSQAMTKKRSASRHCERSEAIHATRKNGLLRRCAPLRKRFAFVAGNDGVTLSVIASAAKQSMP